MATITDLTLRVRGGDDEAREELSRRLLKVVSYYVCCRLGSNFLAEQEEIIQETMLEFLRAFGRFDRSKGTLEAWIIGFAKNLIARTLSRPRFAEISGDVLGKERTPSSEFLNRDAVAMVRAEVKTLSPGEQELVSVHIMDEVPLTKLARESGKTRETLRVLKSSLFQRIEKLEIWCEVAESLGIRGWEQDERAQ
ncbi:MAG: sigma-70 family RNA polymerase sigma factor [Planctomycetota bacterium]